MKSGPLLILFRTTELQEIVIARFLMNNAARIEGRRAGFAFREERGEERESGRCRRQKVPDPTEAVCRGKRIKFRRRVADYAA